MLIDLLVTHAKRHNVCVKARINMFSERVCSSVSVSVATGCVHV